MNLTETIALVWVVEIALLDLFLWLSGRETITQMMTRLGRSRWWVPVVYATTITYFFFHFWPQFLPW